MYDIHCPVCGEEMTEWHNNIYECSGCETMIDMDEFEELEVPND